MNAARASNTTTLLADGKVLVTGGTTSRFPIGSAEVYDPTADTWTLTGKLVTPRYGHTATLLTDGSVLLVGGEGTSISCGKACTSYIPTARVEIYNEAAGTFTAATSLGAARAYQSTTLLRSGGALTDGGSGTTSTCCVVLNSAAFYTPLSLTLSSSALSFGLLQTRLTSAAQTVTVTDVSKHNVTFSSIAASGQYLESNTCPTTLNPGRNCVITVTFAPTAAGVQNGSTILTDNSPGSPKQTISLSGTGEANAISFSPASLIFPGTTPGVSSLLTTTLNNAGAAGVTLTSVGVTAGGPTFKQTNNCPASLNPGQNCTVSVTFTPPDSGNYGGKISAMDSAAGSPQILTLSGTGLDN
jgi:hypothetical protein